MKKTILTALAITLTVGGMGIATSVSAHSRSDKPSFEMMDLNGDGALDATELQAQITTKITERMGERMGGKMFGENNKGPAAGRLEHMVEHMLERGDTDGNGSISAEEWAQMAKNGPRGGGNGSNR